jgi:hypothetical protein
MEFVAETDGSKLSFLDIAKTTVNSKDPDILPA